MKKIELTQGQAALVDDGDYEELSQYSWYAMRRKYTFYVRRTVHSPMVNGKRTVSYVFMHQQLLGMRSGVDHKNGDGLDNRRSNLRPCTKAQNAWNRRLSDRGSNRYRGVSRAAGKRWEARIQCDGSRKRIGYFSSEKDAALAYNKEALVLYGEFARLNVL